MELDDIVLWLGVVVCHTFDESVKTVPLVNLGYTNKIQFFRRVV